MIRQEAAGKYYIVDINYFPHTGGIDMARKRKRPVPIQTPEEKKPITINPNRIKVRDMRGILLSGCGYHEDKKKFQSKYSCRRKGREEDLD